MRRPLASGLRILVALVFIGTGAAKAADASDVRAVIEHLAGPIALRPLETAWVAACIAGAEVALGLALLMESRMRWAWYAAASMVTVFTVVLVALALDRDAPPCGCMGVLGSGRGGPQPAVAGIVRNMGLLGAIGVVLFRRGPWTEVRCGRVRTGPDLAHRAARRGVSVIEMVVVVALIGALLALALPALRGARRQAHNAAALHTIAQLHAATVLYADDHADAFPYLAMPGRPDAKLVVNGHLLKQSVYFEQSRLFVNLLYPVYYGDGQSLVRPFAYGAPMPDGVIVSRFDITNCVFAAPPYWVGDTPPDDPALYRGTRLHDMLFPSHKGLLLDMASDMLDPRLGRRVSSLLTVGMGDGSAGFRSADVALPTVTRPYGSTPWPIMSTEGGLHGRDF